MDDDKMAFWAQFVLRKGANIISTMVETQAEIDRQAAIRQRDMSAARNAGIIKEIARLINEIEPDIPYLLPSGRVIDLKTKRRH